MTGGNILQTIIDNKDRIEYVRKEYFRKEYADKIISYHIFKFKSTLRNIFGLNKYFLIEVYNHLEKYKYGDVLEMKLKLPSNWNYVKIPTYLPEAKKISRILYDIYVKAEYNAEYNNDLKLWKQIGKLLKGC